jgi:hypothetical protein
MYSTVKSIFHFSHFYPDYPTSGLSATGLARVYGIEGFRVIPRINCDNFNRTMPQLRRFVTGFSRRKQGFNSRLLHVRLVPYELPLGQDFQVASAVSWKPSLHHCSVLIHYYSPHQAAHHHTLDLRWGLHTLTQYWLVYGVRIFFNISLNPG